jgi:8-hydroxy-5-deazaflavin:NADPH oxidoreductase
MNIGIIGAGNIGGTLTRRFTTLGHKVFVANSRGPETLRDLAAETGAKAVTAKEAARSGDVVIVTIPLKNIPELPQDLFQGVGDHVVVVDTGNYYPQQRDGRIDAIEKDTPESRWVEQQLHRPVIKAFNNIYAQHLMDLGSCRNDWADSPAGCRRRQGREIHRAATRGRIGIRWRGCRWSGRILETATGHSGLRNRFQR